MTDEIELHGSHSAEPLMSIAPDTTSTCGPRDHRADPTGKPCPDAPAASAGEIDGPLRPNRAETGLARILQ
jgi:hypothetical protein